jgi:acetolactate synthase-1/2/3 large subunit
MPSFRHEIAEPTLPRRRSESYVRELKPNEVSMRSELESELGESFEDALAPEAEVGPSSSLSPNSAARRLVRALVARGVDTFFGIPGGPICPVFEAIRLTPGATLVESRHETHAAFAAALFHRVSGRVPAVVVTAGPGITNAVTGVASASLERVPMLVIAGDVAWATTGGRMLQDSGPEGIAIEAMFAPVTRAQVRAADSRSVVTQAIAALDLACNPMLPGPALFVLPLDRAMGPCDEVDLPPRITRWSAAPPPDSVRRTTALLREARRPLIVLGAGCRGHEAAVRALVDACHIPFVTTPRAKGIVSERHPRSLRNGGMAASIWARRYTASPVDVCLVLGSDLDDVSTGPTPYLGEGGTLIHVDLDSRVFGRNVRTALGVNADVGLFAQAVCDEIGTTGLVNARARMALKDARSVSPFDVPEASSDDAVPIRPHRLLADLEAAAGPRARFVSDVGEHMLFALHYLTAPAPDSFHLQLRLGSMGSGIAGAVGMALADRTRPVVCIAGDGCMQMAGMEALVAVRERLDVLFVVFNDGRYNMVHQGMRQIFGEASEYDSPQVDFCAWAASMGMPSALVSGPGEITRELVESLLGRGGPAVIDARIDPDVRIRGGGRVEALQHMSMLSSPPVSGTRAK